MPRPTALLLLLLCLPLWSACGDEPAPAQVHPEDILGEESNAPTAFQDAGPTGIRFRDVSSTAGMRTPNHSGRAGVKEFLVEAVGPGGAWLDYDADGLLDLYVPDGDVFDNYAWEEVDNPLDPGKPRRVLRQVERSRRAESFRDQLWRNNGDGTFTDVAEAAGIVEERWSYGSTTFDVDADGDTDIFVANYGPNVLWRNNGDGTFTDIAAEVGLQGSPWDWSTCAAVGDVDGDGRLDLYVAAYSDSSAEVERARLQKKLPPDTPARDIGGRLCNWKGIKAYCGPIGLQGQHDTLYRQREDGRFEDVSEAWGLRPRIARYAFTCLMFDFNEDGLLDIYVANDSVENFMWEQHRDADGRVRFRETSDALGIKVGNQISPQAAMGMAVADIDRDGMLDIFVTNFSHDYNNMYMARRGGSAGGGVHFRDRGMQALGQEVFYDLSWGCGWYDFENDGDLDLYVATGHVYKEIDLFDKTGSSYEQYNALFECMDPSAVGFRRIGTRAQEQAGPGVRKEDLDAGNGLAVKKCSRQAAFGDWNNDGRMDIVVMEMNEPPTVLLNESRTTGPDGAPGGQWIKLTLRQPGGDRDALGAIVDVRAGGITHRLANVRQTSFLGCDDPRLHVGLGAATTCDAEVIWPGPERARTVFRDLAANAHYLLDRESGQATALPLRTFTVP